MKNDVAVHLRIYLHRKQPRYLHLLSLNRQAGLLPRYGNGEITENYCRGSFCG